MDARWKKHGGTALAIAQMTGDSVILVSLSTVVIAFEVAAQEPGKAKLDWFLYLMTTLAVASGAIANFAHSGIYDVMRKPAVAEVLTATVRRFLEVLLALTGCLFLLKLSDTYSRLWLVAWGTSSMVALCGFRLLVFHVVRRLVRSRKLVRKVAIVGANEVGRRLALRLDGESRRGTLVVGLFDRDPPLSGRDTPCSQDMAALDDLLAQGEVDEIIIALPVSEANERISELIRRFHPFPVSVRIIATPEFEKFRVLDNLRYGDINTFLVARRPLNEVASVVKWLEDKVLAGLCLLAASPLMLLIVLAIKLDSPGPALFRQQRRGVNSRPFDLLKFRSMYVDRGDPLGRELTRSGDPRITRVGRLLRSSSLDELPQLVNVLRGDMSLVGPRPHALEAHAGGISYGEAVNDYWLRHRVKPGITGWAQVNGWRGETERIEQLKGRVECDLYYIENWSLALDFLILGRTVLAVLSRQNAV